MFSLNDKALHTTPSPSVWQSLPKQALERFSLEPGRAKLAGSGKHQEAGAPRLRGVERAAGAAFAKFNHKIAFPGSEGKMFPSWPARTFWRETLCGVLATLNDFREKTEQDFGTQTLKR